MWSRLRGWAGHPRTPPRTVCLSWSPALPPGTQQALGRGTGQRLVFCSGFGHNPSGHTPHKVSKAAAPASQVDGGTRSPLELNAEAARAADSLGLTPWSTGHAGTAGWFGNLIQMEPDPAAGTMNK